MTDAAHIHPTFQYVLRLSDKDRIRFLDEERWVGYLLANRIIEMLHGLMEKPTRPRMPNLLIVGESNNGKTTILRHFLARYGQGGINDEAEPVRPVIVSEAPPSADEKGLYVAILSQFRRPYRVSDSTVSLRYQVVNMMRTCHVRLLAIDEFHSLLAGTAAKQREVMNAIKLLCNTLAIPIVGVGTGEAVRVLHTDPQHASRFDVIKLPLWNLDREFQSLLRGFEQILPLRKPSNLYRAELAAPLHAISEGNIGNLHQLLVECARGAIESGSEVIDKPLIESKKWLRPTRGIRELVV